jgi:replicative DNA helicase
VNYLDRSEVRESRDDRLPPQSPEAEVGLIGAMLSESDCVDDVLAIIKPEDLWTSDHQIICRAIRDMRREGRNIDVVTVCSELTRRGELDKIGGKDTLFNFPDRIGSTANVTYYAKIVKQCSSLRDLIRIGRSMIERGYAQSMPSEDQLATAEREIYAISQTTVTGEVKTLADAADRAFEQITRVKNGEVIGISTGWVDLDSMIGGLQDTNLIVIAARPGCGKSSFALNMAEYASLVSGKRSLFVSQEMSDLELATRSIVSQTRIDAYNVKNAFLKPAQLEQIAQTCRDFRTLGNFFIDDTPGRTVSQIASLIRRLSIEKRIDVAFIDYMQLLDNDTEGRENRQEQVSRISRGLKRLAMEFRIPVVALSQLNRKSDEGDGRAPRMSDLRESGAIENDANIVILLHRLKAENGKDFSGVVDVIVDKNRNGPTGTIPMTFLSHIMRFESLSQDQNIDFGPAF